MAPQAGIAETITEMVAGEATETTEGVSARITTNATTTGEIVMPRRGGATHLRTHQRTETVLRTSQRGASTRETSRTTEARS